MGLNVSLMFTAFLFTYKPYEDTHSMRMDVFNEITTIGLIYTVYLFSDLVQSAER